MHGQVRIEFTGDALEALARRGMNARRASIICNDHRSQVLFRRTRHFAQTASRAGHDNGSATHFGHSLWQRHWCRFRKDIFDR
jgi:hypothetical protein